MPIPEAGKLPGMNAYCGSFYDKTDDLAEGLYNGRITLGMWEEEMRTRLRIHFYGSAAIGKGGIEELNRSDKGWVGSQLKKQYRWLHGFAQDIYDNKDTVSLEAIQARAHLYADAGRAVASAMQAGELRNLLSWIPGDGQTACWNGCGCTWENLVMGEDKEADTKEVVSTWTMHPEKEHCEDCVDRNGHSETNTVSIGMEVPPSIGLGG